MEERKLIVKLIEENANLKEIVNVERAMNMEYEKDLNNKCNDIIALKERCEKSYELGKENNNKEWDRLTTELLKQRDDLKEENKELHDIVNQYGAPLVEKDKRISYLENNISNVANEKTISFANGKSQGLAEGAQRINELELMNKSLHDKYDQLKEWRESDNRQHDITIGKYNDLKEKVKELQEENSKAFELGKKFMKDFVIQTINEYEYPSNKHEFHQGYNKALQTIKQKLEENK